MPYGYVVIKGQGQTAMVDVGYNHKAYGQVLADELRRPELAAAARRCSASAALTPADVSTVFITHAHFDHMGNIEDFPNATFYIQERELSKWVWAMSLERRFRWLMLGIDPADIMRTVDLARQGRLVAVDGDRENVLPGIDLHAAFDTHTWGSMYVHGPQRSGGRVRRTPWVFAGDLAYCHENLRGDDPADPQYIPVGSGHRQPVQPDHDRRRDDEAGSAAIRTRVIPVHEERLEGSVSVADHQGRPADHGARAGGRRAEPRPMMNLCDPARRRWTGRRTTQRS